MYKTLKTLLAALILFLYFNQTHSQTSFFWQHPLPTGNLLEAVKFIDQQTGFATGAAGTIMKTTNGGGNWVVQPSPVYAYLWDVTYVNANIWIVVGVYQSSGNNGVILRTTNAGNNWSMVQNMSGENYKGVDFPAPNAGYVVGAGTIYKSTDQGATWVLQPTGLGNFYSVDFFDEQFGAAAGLNSLSITTNGGINWVSQNGIIEFPGNLVAGIVQLDANTIIGAVDAASDGYIIRTTNGGLNWTNYHNFLNLNGEIVRDMEMINNTGFIVSNNGRILKTTSGGLNWLTDSSFIPAYPAGLRFMSVNMLNENDLFLAGGGGAVVKSTNSGTNWILTTGFQSLLNGIYFTDMNSGYACGNGGTILKTTNAGNNWIEIPPVTNRHFNSVYFADLNSGYAAGDTGVIVKTTNAGLNWNMQTSGTNKNLLSVVFTSLNTGYATGGEHNNGQGVIIKTTNGGGNWFTQLSGSSMDFTSLYFLNNDSGFAVTTSNLYKTVNGGTNWIVVTGVEGYDIYFINNLTGYAMGSNPNVYKTTNGGDNWFITSTGYNNAYLSVQFFGNFGIAAGNNGSILKTTNGGVNWSELSKITENRLQSVNFIDENTGYIAGFFGTILKTTNGGLSFLSANNEVIPKSFSLYQNYPNPFNPSTKIKFEIPSNAEGKISNIKLRIFDIQGKEIIKLVDEELSPGIYDISFDGSLLSTGVYFYRIETSEFTETKKMILIK